MKKIISFASAVVALVTISCTVVVRFPHTPGNVECAKKCMLVPQRYELKPCHFTCNELGCDALCSRNDTGHIDCLKACNVEIKTQDLSLDRIMPQR
jgi:hypothetical protein